MRFHFTRDEDEIGIFPSKQDSFEGDTRRVGVNYEGKHERAGYPRCAGTTMLVGGRRRQTKVYRPLMRVGAFSAFNK